jgi:hypothetical protein
MANYIPIDHLNEDYDADRSVMTPSRRRKIHKHREYMDKYGPELPYKIGNFKKKLPNLPRNYWLACDSCGHEMAVSRITYIVICSKCGNLCKIEGEE